MRTVKSLLNSVGNVLIQRASHDRLLLLLWLFFPLMFLLPFTGCRQSESRVDAGPESALNTFELEPGFRIELVAAEPLVADPVDMEIDEYGRLYVVEMFGYPLDKSGTGKIKILTDTDGDGRMDKSSVYA